jgi:hypothetical protein
MTEVLIRVRQDLEERLAQVEAELSVVEPLIAERAELRRVLASHPFDAVDAPPAG